jgi:uncharacterized protein YecT (DUF1311 family)
MPLPLCCVQRSTYAVKAAEVYLALAGCLLPAGAAQQAPVAAGGLEPAFVQFQNPIAGERLAFLNGFAGHKVKDLIKDKQFRALMKTVIPRTEYHYGRDMSLYDALDTVLDGSPLAVNLRDGRFLMITGKRGPYLHGRGFLWFDLEQGIALGGFYFTPTNGEPTPTMTIFSRQLKQDAIAMGMLPPAFVEDLLRWSVVFDVPSITPRYFIPESGKKYVLEHDEDYCSHAENQPEPPHNQCEEANAQAADTDLNAAYFMKQTRNAANATAWMLGPEQLAWFGFRDRSCGVGADRWGCRIRMTRERTRVILGPPSRQRGSL